MAQSNTSLRRENGGRTIWHQDKKSGQFGIKQVNRQFGTKIRKWTIWHWNAYLAHSKTNISGAKQKTHKIDYLTTSTLTTLNGIILKLSIFLFKHWCKILYIKIQSISFKINS